MELTIETFRREIDAAMLSYDRHVVCVFKTPDDCLEAIEPYENRADGMRHGIALDKEITIMLSQGESAAPLCGIYFNLHSPYSREDGGRNITQTGAKAEANPPN
jgi:hypothetical protein